MTRTSTKNQVLQSVMDFWEARNPRERVILLIGVTVLLLGLIYLLLVDPALTGRAQLQRSLPQMRQQQAEMQRLADEAARLPKEAASAAVPVTRDNIDAALTRRGLKPQNLVVTNDSVRLQLSSVSFAGLLDWLNEMQRTALLIVVEANIVALAQPDMVNATLTLRQQKSE